MKLDARLDRLEVANPVPVTAEMFLADMWKMRVYDDERVGAMSRRMPEAELEKALAEIGRLIKERDG